MRMENFGTNSHDQSGKERMAKEKLTWTPKDEELARKILSEEKNIDASRVPSPVMRYIMAAEKINPGFKYRKEDQDFRRVLACIGHIGASIKEARKKAGGKAEDSRTKEFYDYAAKNPSMLHPEDEAELIEFLKQEQS